jgi:hypothetical protein
MRSLIFAILIASGTVSVGAQAPGGAPFDLNSKLINAPDSNWTIYGPGQTNTRLEQGDQRLSRLSGDVTQSG